MGVPYASHPRAFVRFSIVLLLTYATHVRAVKLAAESFGTFIRVKRRSGAECAVPQRFRDTAARRVMRHAMDEIRASRRCSPGEPGDRAAGAVCFGIWK